MNLKPKSFRVNVWYASGKGAWAKRYKTSEAAEAAAGCFREEGYLAVVIPEY